MKLFIMIKVKVKKLSENAIVPRYAHEGDAGMDLFSAENYIILGGKRQLVSTGVAMELPEGYFASIRGKSGWHIRREFVFLVV